jgi:hypothetical protein
MSSATDGGHGEGYVPAPMKRLEVKPAADASYPYWITGRTDDVLNASGHRFLPAQEALLLIQYHDVDCILSIHILNSLSDVHCFA